jgi:mannose-1-phosphate guanylyltransferase
LILAAGIGSRLRPLSYARAKAALPVAGEPLIRRILRYVAGCGVSDVVINLHAHPATITGSIGDGAEVKVGVRYSWEPVLLGSGGGPRHALPLLDDPFILLNGDTITDVDLAALRAEHVRSGAEVTMALIPNPNPAQYGGVEVDSDGWVRRFTAPGAQTPSFHFIGAQVVNRRVFANMPDDTPFSTVGGIYTDLLRRERGIRAFVCDAMFRDIGTPYDYLHTSLALAGSETALSRGVGSDIHPSAQVTRTAVWKGVTIERECVVMDSVLADGVVVPAGSRLVSCAVVRKPAVYELAQGELIRGDLIVAPLRRGMPMDVQMELSETRG